MVKIPKLTEDGQNWKIYRAKFLEVAATYDCLKVLAGRPYEGDDWDGCNALLCCTFMESVPPSIYFRHLHYTAHENFKYLVKHFRDNEPIPRVNELQCTGTAAVAETPENYPTSDNAATERHASAERNKEDLSNTTQDPCTSTEAPAMGTSTKCIEMTPVIFESMLHESQNWLQSSLPLTPRLPIEGEPSRCKQEVADSNVMATHTNGMAKPTDADIDLEEAPLGGDLADRACRVDEGSEEREPQLRPQETDLICKEADQRNANANANVPVAYGLPLEGEWTVYASGEVNNSEHDADTSNELTEPLMTTIEPDDADGGGVPSMYLGGMRWHAGDASRPEGQSDRLGCQTDGPNGQVDGSRGSADALNVLNNAEIDCMSHGEGLSMYLGVGGPKRRVEEADNARTHADTSNGLADMPSVEMDTSRSANAPEIVSIP